jgi:DNA-binding response OmpR family regulator
MSLPVAKRILVVEDEMMISMMLEDMLTEMGHEVVGIAPNLQIALGLAASERFDLAILDVNLAGERSFPVARLIRERGLPFLFATGYGTLGLEDSFHQTLTLKKPFKEEELAQAIETVTAVAAA